MRKKLRHALPGLLKRHSPSRAEGILIVLGRRLETLIVEPLADPLGV